jgi:UDP-N-acetylmuramoyl-L-alanyl-D-glutamate--2,6-diaminopimelate ligase
MAGHFYGTVASTLDIVGFTGTFGKTSTSEILRALLTAGGVRTGVIGSLGARYGAFHDPGNGLTTPAPVELHRALAGLRDAGAGTAIVEVTSHALRMHRAHGLSFAGGLIAAIMPGEHTDFHRTFDDYVAAKRLFLDYLRPGALLAFDADNQVAATLAAEATEAIAVGVSIEGREAALQVRDVVLDHTGARFTLVVGGPGAPGNPSANADPNPNANLDPNANLNPNANPNQNADLNSNPTQTQTRTRPITENLKPITVSMSTPLLGPGHLRNVALALAYATAAGVSPETAGGVLKTLVPLRRRMERYLVGARSVLDDTAAHPDSLRATFEVAGMISAGLAAAHGCGRIVAVYAVRGRRGPDVNHANAVALAQLTGGGGSLIVTAAADTTAASDRATAEEIDAARFGLLECGCGADWYETLRGAVRAALDRTRPGDLIVLVGAQGMNEGKRLMLEES